MTTLNIQILILIIFCKHLDKNHSERHFEKKKKWLLLTLLYLIICKMLCALLHKLSYFQAVFEEQPALKHLDTVSYGTSIFPLQSMTKTQFITSRTELKLSK